MTNQITLEHQGQRYTATWRLQGQTVVISHHQATNQASIGSEEPALLARQLLFELVARKGLGVPDLPAAP